MLDQRVEFDDLVRILALFMFSKTAQVRFVLRSVAMEVKLVFGRNQGSRFFELLSVERFDRKPKNRMRQRRSKFSISRFVETDCVGGQ